MPIYAYRCAACGHTQDVLQKLSDEPLVVCPACGASAFSKQLTAPGFQLKGSGWYATDFKNNGAAKPPASGAKDEPAKEAPASKEAASDGAGKPAADAKPAAAPASGGGSSGA